MSIADIGWDRLRHGGLLLDPARLRQVIEPEPAPLPFYVERELRRQGAALQEGGGKAPEFVTFVLEKVCGFTPHTGTWLRGSQVGAEWGRRAITGETVKPRHLWQGRNGAVLPVFFDTEARLGIGRGRKSVSQVLQWLRAGGDRLALITNGRQWRLLFAGIDFDAWCEWDIDLWFEEGALSAQVHALRALIRPDRWTPPGPDAASPLLQAILDSRKGQAELSALLGERVREAVELLVRAHGEPLKAAGAELDPAEIYRAAVRVVMRMVVVLFAESRELLPRDNALYHGSYGLTGLLAELEKVAARGGNRLSRSWCAWPRVLALFRLVHQGSHHPALPVPTYGGDLFAPGDTEAADGLRRGLAIFENAALVHELVPDRDVYRILERLTRTKVKIRQGRAAMWVPAPVDFSDLSSEYIGILYEGLLDFELRTAAPGDPVVFLAVGHEPALPLSRLEAMDDAALGSLLEKMKDTSKADGESAEDEDAGEESSDEVGEPDDVGEESEEAAASEPEAETGDERHATRTRAETWARRAAEVGKLVAKPRGTLTPERRLAYEEALSRKARQLVSKVVLSGEWYLVRWGGTRKGSGTFYTRPGLAVPTVQRTLRPLCYDEGPAEDGGMPGTLTPRPPEEILALQVCDPACGSGTFPVAALRFLTEALYLAVHYHGRVSTQGDCAVVRLLEGPPSVDITPRERLGDELRPCRPDDPLFEPRLKAILRRHVVERCIYGVDLDPLAVELCRLALWIETMDRSLPFSFLDHKIKCGNALVGAWFDQFQHYPVMAWKNREGGDKGHTRGVHFQEEARTRAIKTFVRDRLTPDLRQFLGGRTLFSADLQQQAEFVHSSDLATLNRLHSLPVHDTAERTRIYREELLGSPTHRSLKAAMDLWCACWYWPVDDIEHAPLPSTLAAPAEETGVIAARVAAAKRFFHWELEFPDVFRSAGSGFDAILGNPPWDIAKPNSKEFFSNIDPLYRSYGKQEGLGHQRRYFAAANTERAWLDYNADFRAQSNLVGRLASPFGDPSGGVSGAERFTIVRGKANEALHAAWRSARSKSQGYADPIHAFRYQGAADLNLYKAFLEQAHALLKVGGRLGFIVPSGLYSDHGTRALRELFLDHCRWDWLFGFENREKIFAIDSRFKFNAMVLMKGGRTEAIRTAFMRRRLDDWERAEAIATPYRRAQVDQFSPRSKAILEIQSARDLEILGTIYANSVLLGETGPDGWGIKYATEFHMTNDSRLFPPRPKWEAEGYRPDEYSRWLKGDWRPIEELWAELGVTPLAPGERRCAQPPYDTLPLARADIPPGIVVSREADAWIRESSQLDCGIPLYEGRMVNLYDFSEKAWVSGKGRSAEWAAIPWDSKSLLPQYLMGLDDYSASPHSGVQKLGFLAIGSATNMRSLYCALLPDLPCGHSVATLRTSGGTERLLALLQSMSAFVFDFVVRLRLTGLNLSYFVIEEAPLPKSAVQLHSTRTSTALGFSSALYAPEWLGALPQSCRHDPWRRLWAISEHERTRQRAVAEAVACAHAGLDNSDSHHVLRDCDWTDPGRRSLDPKGFWRVDKDKEPELRLTVLTLVAFHDLKSRIIVLGGDLDRGIEDFLNQNGGEGWMLPETLRLADYGLGHDERAKEHQPVAARLGPRFYDWQLSQSADESWRECHLHARNLLGEEGYQRLLIEIEGGAAEPVESDRVEGTAPVHGSAKAPPLQGSLFE